MWSDAKFWNSMHVIGSELPASVYQGDRERKEKIEQYSDLEDVTG